ncbi:hypothetical protein GCM10010307_57380 [Streptomyces vastus]|uniref:Uncharacterized protein n=1 Tax=Streptomyces vastus TaxID=285451 RepID=A0ABN3RCY8_9ACTN
MLAAPDEDTFVRQLLGSLGSYPAYFDRLGEINRRGPAVLDTTPTLAPLSTAQTRQLLGEGAQIIDVRPVAAPLGSPWDAVQVAAQAWMSEHHLDVQRPMLGAS